MDDLRVHPLAALFPMMSDAELQLLADDIKANRQKEAILKCDGEIIDGRNRLAACKIAGVQPWIEVSTDLSDDPEAKRAYIISKNLHRRHLTTSQRAAIAAELANWENGNNQYTQKEGGQKCPPTITNTQAADMLNVSERAVKQAKAVAAADPELADKVKAGEVSVGAAYKKVTAKKQQPEPAEEVPAETVEQAPEWDYYMVYQPTYMVRVEHGDKPTDDDRVAAIDYFRKTVEAELIIRQEGDANDYDRFIKRFGKLLQTKEVE